MKKSIIMAIIGLTLTACHKEQKSSLDDKIITERREVTVDNSIHHLNPLDESDTLSWAGHHYQYRVVREPGDSSSVVVCEDNLRYLDNSISISIARDGADFFQYRFTKADFTSSLSKLYREHGILLNTYFDKAGDKGLVFKLIIGSEEAESQAIFDIFVGSDGSYRFEPGDLFDEEDIDRIEDPEV